METKLFGNTHVLIYDDHGNGATIHVRDLEALIDQLEHFQWLLGQDGVHTGKESHHADGFKEPELLVPVRAPLPRPAMLEDDDDGA